MGRLPPWAKGQLRECAICGYWWPERDWRIRFKEGKWVCWQDDDKLTDKERAEQLNNFINR